MTATKETRRNGLPSSITLPESSTCLPGESKKKFLVRNLFRFLLPDKEHNVRDEILDPRQVEQLQTCSPSYLQPINYVAYMTGMREREILGLTWEKVDLKGGFIRLQAEDTETREGRTIPLNFSMELSDLLKRLHKVCSFL